MVFSSICIRSLENTCNIILIKEDVSFLLYKHCSCDAVYLSCQAGALQLSAYVWGSANMKSSFSLLLCEFCRLIVISPSLFHFMVTIKWLSAVRLLGSSLSTDRIDFTAVCAAKSHTAVFLLNATTTVTPTPAWYRGSMCACAARWTLSGLKWNYECGLFFRLHLGLHMVRQTVAGEAGGNVGRAHLQWARLHLHSPTGHRHKWQTERLQDHPARQTLLWILTSLLLFLSFVAAAILSL